MAMIIAVANHKGGVGKTSTTFHLAGEYTKDPKHKVLLVDLDPQASLTKALGFRPENCRVSLADLLSKNPVSPGEATHETSIPGVFLIPANAALADAEKGLIPRLNRETVLARVLRPFSQNFDATLLDCPPALDLLNTNGVAACDFLLIPVESSHLSLQVVGDFLTTATEIVGAVNPDFKGWRILLTKHQTNTAHSREVLAELNRRYPGKVFPVSIPQSVQAKDAIAARQPIGTYNARSPVAEAYMNLHQEITQHV